MVTIDEEDGDDVTYEIIAEAIADEALTKGSMDNITVVILFF